MGRHGSFTSRLQAMFRRTLAVVMLGMLVAVPAALGTPPGKDGRIAYMVKDRAGHWQVWVAKADLSDGTKLTHGRYDSGWPVWSPHRKQLAFDSDRTDHTPH